jgi:mono/diheme cytochrome c family protein
MLFRRQEVRAMNRHVFGIAVIGVSLTACKVSQPGNVESSVAREIKQRVTVGGKDVKNPIAYSPEIAKEGQDHFGHHCQICHGLDGQNTGVPFAIKMDPPVPDLNTKDVQDYADGQLKWIIENGVSPSGMPAWKDILSDDEMWKIVHYIRHLPPKGSLGAPDVYREEAAEHEATKSGRKSVHSHAPGTKPHKH